MPRNLYNRVELVVPMHDDKVRAELVDILDRSLADNTNSWELDADGEWIRREPGDEPRIGPARADRAPHRAFGLRRNGRVAGRLSAVARRRAGAMAERHDAHGYWLAEAGPAEPAPALRSDREADVLIAGGGYTGMWTAWHVKRLRPEARVVLCEAEACGEGPSGRNGGFVNGLWFSLPTLRDRFGDGPAIEVARAAQRSVDEIGAFCREQRHRRLVSPGRLPAGLDRARLGRRLGARS